MEDHSQQPNKASQVVVKSIRDRLGKPIHRKYDDFDHNVEERSRRNYQPVDHQPSQPIRQSYKDDVEVYDYGGAKKRRSDESIRRRISERVDDYYDDYDYADDFQRNQNQDGSRQRQ